ncbi:MULTISPECIES: glycosyltransferase family 2 protein [unclassified Ectothiorhodospira]|uniref:glycosyltransferase family 2 protein n=1 Tax=unclassified Ectothiorhodospira TaxID=2684909 RepID=UPI001EE79BA2|nr:MULTISPECIES: glycosyltransferase family 2 protein [unclassified Ectothiorhodospira]MCG5517098.1 glycosyltransferase [Ectothiorhodospira sp. 9100]MCG5519760.1 glycosyltransferase [Ectothiorhodospira sp. 9905]
MSSNASQGGRCKTMGCPQASVIVPVYNAADTLKNSVSSLLRQHLSDLEIILVDDASSDSTASVMQSLAGGDARIKTIFKAVNAGVHEARRSGLEAATGQWIGFMDADDHVEPEMFQRMLSAAKTNDSDIVICSVDRVAPSGERLGMKFRFREEQCVTDHVYDRFCRHEFGTGSLWNKLYRRELIMEHGLSSFRWRQDINEDTLVNIGCFMSVRKVTTLPAILYHYVARQNSASMTDDKARALTDMLRAYGLAVELYSHHGPQVMKGIDILYRTQLSYPCYYLEDPSALYEHGHRLSEVMAVLSARHPAGVGVLVSYLGRPKQACPTSLAEQWSGWCHSTIMLASQLKSALSRRLNHAYRRIGY